jgi:hypothetical protein
MSSNTSSGQDPGPKHAASVDTTALTSRTKPLQRGNDTLAAAAAKLRQPPAPPAGHTKPGNTMPRATHCLAPEPEPGLHHDHHQTTHVRMATNMAHVVNGAGDLGVSAMHVNSRPRTAAMPGTMAHHHEASLQPDHGGNDHRSRCRGKPQRAPLCPGHRCGHSSRLSPLPPTVGHAAAAGSHRHMEEGGPVVHRPRRTHDVGPRRHSRPQPPPQFSGPRRTMTVIHLAQVGLAEAQQIRVARSPTIH